MSRLKSHPEDISARHYTLGFGLSLILTLLAYFLASRQIDDQYLPISKGLLLSLLIGLAMAQFIIQMIFFLHLGRNDKGYLNRLVFYSMLSVVVILVLGSLWIMSHLNYHGMTPSQTEQHILHDEGIYD